MKRAVTLPSLLGTCCAAVDQVSVCFVLQLYTYPYQERTVPPFGLLVFTFRPNRHIDFLFRRVLASFGLMTGLGPLTLGSSASPSFSSSTNSVTSTAASASFTAPSTPLTSSFGEAGMGVDEDVPAFVCVREGNSGDGFDDDAAGIGSRWIDSRRLTGVIIWYVSGR